MIVQKPIMGWNSWNTFGSDINEKLILETVDAMVEMGYRDAGYEYVIIDDCWSLKERQNGNLVANPELFPNGMKYIADYIHANGMKFGMYSCAGIKTCAGYPSSYGYEYEDAKQFADWGVDYLKYDFCNFPLSGDAKNAYLTMAVALRSTGRDIVFAACNWGKDDPEKWMRAYGANTYRSTVDIHDVRESFIDIFKSQYNNVLHNGPGCYNDMDMLIVGMNGKGHVALGGCTTEQYAMHFAMWAFMGSPLIIGGDIRNMNDEDKSILLNKGMIAINQDNACMPAFPLDNTRILHNDKMYSMMKLLSDGKFAVAVFNTDEPEQWAWESIIFDDMGIHSNKGKKVKLTNAVTGEELGIFEDGYRISELYRDKYIVLIGEVCE